MSRVRLGFVFWVTMFAVMVGHAGLAAAQTNTVADVEVVGGSTLNLQGSRALVALSNGRSTTTADSGEAKVLPTIGFAVNIWRSRNIGSFFDFSYVDGGTASAGIGSNVSNVTSSLFDLHAGFQLQSSFGRVRPYGLIGGGFAHTSTTGTLTLSGVTNSLNSSQWLSSIVYGGGVRVMLGDRVGVRIGFEGITATPMRSESGNGTTYGRLLVGPVFSSKS